VTLPPPTLADGLRLVVLRYQVVYRTERELAALEPRLRRVAVPLETFARQLDALASANLAVIDPGKLAGDVPPRPGIVLTFDGGHASLYAYALPLLIQRGLTAAFFVSRDRIGATGNFQWSHLRDLVGQRMTLGSAGCSGEPFDRLTAAQAALEFRASREAIEDGSGKGLVQFAFPRGRYQRRQIAIGTDAGYRVFYSSRVGAQRPVEISTRVPRRSPLLRSPSPCSCCAHASRPGSAGSCVWRRARSSRSRRPRLGVRARRASRPAGSLRRDRQT
jgi:peptidoglycan/xylan/chitin deacetylase (PgdA/CDA1 family)